MPTFNSRIGNSSISNDGGCKYSDADLDQSSDSNSDEFEIVDSINDGTCESTGDEFDVTAIVMILMKVIVDW